jgi:hypothetical protein
MIELIFISLDTLSSHLVSTKMKSRLARIAARLTLKDGKTRSMEEVLELLADAYEEKEKESAKK